MRRYLFTQTPDLIFRHFFEGGGPVVACDVRRRTYNATARIPNRRQHRPCAKLIWTISGPPRNQTGGSDAPAQGLSAHVVLPELRWSKKWRRWLTLKLAQRLLCLLVWLPLWQRLALKESVQLFPRTWHLRYHRAEARLDFTIAVRGSAAS